MCTAEIIEEINKLPREEQQKIAAYLAEFSKLSGAKPNTGISASFKQVADRVFTANADLFQKLAQ